MCTGRPARIENYRDAPGNRFANEIAGLHASAGVPIAVDGQLWGMLAATSMDGPLPSDIEGRLSQFAGTVATAVAGAQARAELRALADKQAALRRVAKLIARGAEESQIYHESLQQFGGLMAAAVANAEARGQLKDFADEQVALRRVAELAAHDAPTEQVLQAVAVEASGLAGVEFGMVLQYEGRDGANRIVALNGAPDTFAVGMRAPGAGDSSVQRVWHTRQVARVDDLGQMSGRWPRLAHERGFKASAGVPIVIHGALWGALIVCGRSGPVPRHVEEHLSNFAELAATAISAAHARQELSMLADEQAALRRIAELAAREVPAEQILQAVTVEASALAGVDFSTLLHYEPDGSTVIVALAGAPDGITVGMRSPGTGDGATQRVWQTGRPARIDNLAELSGGWPQLAHRHGFNTSAAVPVAIHGILRGTLVVVGRRQAFAHPIEKHLSDFADLAATALSAADDDRRSGSSPMNRPRCAGWPNWWPGASRWHRSSTPSPPKPRHCWETLRRPCCNTSPTMSRWWWRVPTRGRRPGSDCRSGPTRPATSAGSSGPPSERVPRRARTSEPSRCRSPSKDAAGAPSWWSPRAHRCRPGARSG